MTTMKRMSVVIPKNIEQGIEKMKRSDQYAHCSYAEIIRILLKRGLEKDSPPT